MERWREYSYDLYSHIPNTNRDIINLSQHQEQQEKLPILSEEVAAAVKQLKGGKAAGVDNILSELLLKGEQTISILLKMCNEIWLTNKWPKSWTTSIMIPIPKKGNLKECGNYRTISLISHPVKVLLQVILNRLIPQIEPLLKDEQSGFRKGRSTTEQLLNLKAKSKLKLMRAIVMSTALYGCESWTMTTETERRIQAFEFKCLRRILGIPYTAHRTNKSV